jgi:hypothetical protein
MSRITPTDLLSWAVINQATEKEDTTTAGPTNVEPIDSKWIELIMGKPDSARMKELVEILKNGTSLQEKMNAADELEMLVEQVDNANDLQPLKCWPELLFVLQNDTEPEVRKFVAWIMATAVQNNPKAQDHFERNGGMDAVLDAFQIEKDGAVRLKLLLCISASIRQNPSNFEAFEQKKGFEVLMGSFKDGNNDIIRRCLFLFTSLIQEESKSSKATIEAISRLAIVEMVTEGISNHDIDLDTAEQTIYFFLALEHSNQFKLNKSLILDNVDSFKSIKGEDTTELNRLAEELINTLNEIS